MPDNPAKAKHIVYSVKRLDTFYTVGDYLLGEFAKLGIDEQAALNLVSLDIMPDDIRRISTLYSDELVAKHNNSPK